MLPISVVGCSAHYECPSEQSCIANQCQNPCAHNNPCNTKQDCQVQDHRPVCLKRECLRPIRTCVPRRYKSRQSVILNRLSALTRLQHNDIPDPLLVYSPSGGVPNRGHRIVILKFLPVKTNVKRWIFPGAGAVSLQNEAKSNDEIHYSRVHSSTFIVSSLVFFFRNLCNFIRTMRTVRLFG